MEIHHQSQFDLEWRGFPTSDAETNSISDHSESGWEGIDGSTLDGESGSLSYYSESEWEGIFDPTSVNARARSIPDNSEHDSDIERDGSDTNNNGYSSDEAELKDSIAYHAAQGKSRPKREDTSNSQIEKEFRKWVMYCTKLRFDDPEQVLKDGNEAIFKGYLERRVKKSQNKESNRIEKASTIKTYWRLLLCKFIDLAGHRLQNGAEIEVGNWINNYLVPEYGLEISGKVKHAMQIDDFWVVHNAHWARDQKPRHGRFRVEMSLMMLLSAATGTRPGAVVESASAKGTNKAILYDHVTIVRARDVADPNWITTLAFVRLVNLKNVRRKGNGTKFVFRLEAIPAFCIVSHLIGLAIADDAFKDRFTSALEIFNVNVPPHKKSIRLRFKDQLLKQPILHGVAKEVGTDMVPDRALTYRKCRNQFQWLGILGGFEMTLEFYQIRRAAGQKMNKFLEPSERNKTMGHEGSTFEKFYIPDLLLKDFQSIYFGTPSNQKLIESAGQMGMSRDNRAPIKLTEKEREEIRALPEISKLRKTRGKLVRKIAKQYGSVNKAKGTVLYEEYQRARISVINKTASKQRDWLKRSIANFHSNIDSAYIQMQREGIEPQDQVQSIVQYEFKERATIVALLPVQLCELGLTQATEVRIKFTQNLARYCSCIETRHDESTNPLNSEPTEDWLAGHRTASSTEIETYPTKLNALVCLICIGDERLSPTRRKKELSSRDALKKHLDCHIRDGIFKNGLQCKHPSCEAWIDGHTQYLNHAAVVHGVFHAVDRH